MSVKKIQRRKQTHVSSKMKHVPKMKNTDKNGTTSKIGSKKSPMKQKKALVIAHEIKFAKLLAGNDKKVRDKVLKNLKKWLAIRSQSSFAFVEQDFMRLWKGLYYCMWMSDKPLIQEELAESLSKLVHCFNNKEAALLYTKCTLSTLASEWFGLDHHRLDKFQMLVRRIIRQTFEMCKKRSWDRQWVDGVEKIIEIILSDSKTSIGFSLHITELYMEELAKVSGGKIPEDIVVELVRPFAIQLAGMSDERQIRHVMKHIFRYLLFQSDVGLDYVEKFEAWRHAGFPKGNIESMQKIEIDEEDEDSDNENESDQGNDEQSQIPEGEKPLDPRAGRVDVELPQIPFDAKAVADLVISYRFHPTSTTKTRRQILRIAKEFNDLSEGKMPLGIKQVKLREGSKAETNPKSAALRLLKFEEELYSDTVKGKRKKKNSQITEEHVEDEPEPVPSKKKLKSLKAKHEDKSKTSTDSKSESDKVNLSKVKSKGINQSKKKLGNLKATEKRVADVVAEVPKKKQKKNPKKILNGEVETNLAEPDALKGLKPQNQTPKQKQINGDSGLCDSELPASVKKSGIENAAKKVKRDSSEGIWSVSENPSPISPSRQNLLIPTPPLLDTSQSVDQLQSSGAEQSWLTPVKTKETVKKVSLEVSQTKCVTPQAQIIKETTTTTTSSLKKKVKIVLQRNTAQHTSEYMRQLRQSPAIPFDANRKPPVGVLKPSPIPSPVNPFYKRGFK